MCTDYTQSADTDLLNSIICEGLNAIDLFLSRHTLLGKNKVEKSKNNCLAQFMKIGTI